MNSEEAQAVAYWQDSLAKFFPTTKGPTTVEINMFVAGIEHGRKTERERCAEVARDAGDENLYHAILDDPQNESCGAI